MKLSQSGFEFQPLQPNLIPLSPNPKTLYLNFFFGRKKKAVYMYSFNAHDPCLVFSQPHHHHFCVA